MPLEFRSREDEGFSIRRFLKTFGAGVAVFLIFMAVGYYLIGPRITVSEEGRLQLRLASQSKNASAALSNANTSKPMPKVEVYEKLSPDVTAGTGVLIGSREVAPFDYERYQQKRRERKPKPSAEAAPQTEEPPAPTDDEYFVPDETPDEPVSTPTEPAPAPTEPPPAEPAPQPPTQTETEMPQQNALYRVQVGVYESRENANLAAQALNTNGFEASIVPFQRDGKTLYRVQVLVTRDRAKADALKSQLESKGFTATIVKAQ
jgi:cell division septation protein DedD